MGNPGFGAFKGWLLLGWQPPGNRLPHTVSVGTRAHRSIRPGAAATPSPAGGRRGWGLGAPASCRHGHTSAAGPHPIPGAGGETPPLFRLFSCALAQLEPQPSAPKVEGETAKSCADKAQRAMKICAPPQHSTIFTASPPREVSLYLLIMSAPVSRMVLMT